MQESGSLYSASQERLTRSTDGRMRTRSEQARSKRAAARSCVALFATASFLSRMLATLSRRGTRGTSIRPCPSRLWPRQGGLGAYSPPPSLCALRALRGNGCLSHIWHAALRRSRPALSLCSPCSREPWTLPAAALGRSSRKASSPLRRSTAGGSRSGGLGYDSSMMLSSSTWGVVPEDDLGAVNDDSYKARSENAFPAALALRCLIYGTLSTPQPSFPRVSSQPCSHTHPIQPHTCPTRWPPCA